MFTNAASPTRSEVLPYGQQWLDEADVEEVIKVLRGKWITQGPYIEEFEQAIAAYVGAKYAVAFTSGTAALHGACFAAGIGPGDEVITSPNTFAASSNCVLYMGATPVFADIREDTYNIDPSQIEKLVTDKTKAIIPVDFAGQPVEMERIREIARKYNLVIIEDAAHSLGAKYGGRMVGTLADMTMFSFHPVKHITTGEGGVIVTDHEEYFHKLQLFRNHGITRDPARLSQNDGPWFYEMQELGFNYRMTDIQAALGISQLSKINKFIERRKEIAAIYNEKLSCIEGLRQPFQHLMSESSWHLYVIRLHAKFDRKKVFEALRSENIGVNVHYIPVYLHPYYQRLGYQPGLCPKAEEYYQSAITLPLFPKMTDSDIDDVIEAVKKVLFMQD